jgi:beta-N-acetylhexosaminidase
MKIIYAHWCNPEMKKKFRFFTNIVLVITCFGNCGNQTSPLSNIKRVPEPRIDERYTIMPDAVHVKLCREYNKRHYGYDSCFLNEPRVIVIHTTYTRSIEATLRIFREPVSKARRDVLHGGAAPVCVHFIIGEDGSIYRYLPLEYTGRHAVGLNYTALGIEIQARDNRSISNEQIYAAAGLTDYLIEKISSVKYVIGHHEYNDSGKPHFYLIKAEDPSYRPWQKSDPGEKVMSEFREKMIKLH